MSHYIVFVTELYQLIFNVIKRLKKYAIDVTSIILSILVLVRTKFTKKDIKIYIFKNSKD